MISENEQGQTTTPKKCSVSVAYATETNNSLQLALHFCISHQQSIQLHKLSPLDESYRFQQDQTTLHIFFISTTGQGDPPYHMRQFWSRIMKVNHERLEYVRFAIFGLGDRGYGENYNVCARKLRQRLLMLGATQSVQIGLGDQQEQGGIWGTYLKQFLPSLSAYVLSHAQSEEPTQPFDLLKLRLDSAPHLNNTQQFDSFIVESSEKLSDVYQKTVFWTKLNRIKAQQESGPIKIGDVLNIYPQNSPQSVAYMLEYFSINNLISKDISIQMLTQYLTYCANLQNTLNYSFFTRVQGNHSAFDSRNLEQYIDSDRTPADIKARFIEGLKELGQSYEEYHHYIKKYKRNVMQVITDFNLKIPAISFIKRLSTIVGRKYSIAEIGDSGENISLLVKLQDHHPTSNRLVKGLCSYDLAASGGKIRYGKILKNGEFAVDLLDVSNPPPIKILMVSLGTGIAPFLSILKQALSFEFTKDEVELVLFHSSRYFQQLPFRQQLLLPLVQSGVLTLFDTYTRQKRDSRSHIQTRRLQFIIEQQLIENGKFSDYFSPQSNSKVMVCGPKQFCQIVERIIGQKLAFNVKQLKRSKKLCVENW